VGDVNLSAFYHQGAVIVNNQGSHLLITEAWGEIADVDPPYGAHVVRCNAVGEVDQNATSGVLSHIPKTALSVDDPKKTTPWCQVTTLVKSCNPSCPAGLESNNPSLLLVPYGPDYGQAIGLLSVEGRAMLAKTARSPAFRLAIENAQSLPGAKQEKKPRIKLSDEAMKHLLGQQGEVIRGIPLVSVIEDFCGYAPDNVKGAVRKYRVGNEFINLNIEKNSFGSLNDFTFKSLSKGRGSTNNAMDMVAAVREMEGVGADFRSIREALIRHYNLQSQLDLMYEDAVRQEAARAVGIILPAGPTPIVTRANELKHAQSKQPAEEAEIPFDLKTGMPVGSKEVDRGGGFVERESLWPTARKYLVEERKLDPLLVDYLYDSKNLYAARRQFQDGSKFPHKKNFQDVIVAPIFGFRTHQIVGVDTKPLPQFPGEKTEGRNHGKTGQGAFMFGTWGDQTKRVVLTEGFIKGIAWLQHHREALGIGEETCVMSRSGAKPTLEIVPRLKELGAEAIVAYDNDFTGRQKSKAFYNECVKQGVPCREMFVEPAEVKVSISHEKIEGLNDPARAIEVERSIVEFAVQAGLEPVVETSSAVENVKPAITWVKLPNTAAVIDFLEEIQKSDRALSNKDYQERAKGLNDFQRQKLEKRRWVRLELINKDWDDVVKKGPWSQRLHPPAGLASLPPPPPPPPPDPPLPPPLIQEEAEITLFQDSLQRGLLVSRQDQATEIGQPIFSIATADAIYDLALSPEGLDAFKMIAVPEQPNPAIITVGRKRTLVSLADQDGRAVDLSAIETGPIALTPAPEQVDQAWRNPAKPAVMEAVERLRRLARVPAPCPSHKPERKIDRNEPF